MHFIHLAKSFYAVDLQGYGRSIRPSTTPQLGVIDEPIQQDLDIALANDETRRRSMTCCHTRTTPPGLVRVDLPGNHPMPLAWASEAKLQ